MRIHAPDGAVGPPAATLAPTAPVLAQSLATKRRSIDAELTMENTAKIRDFVGTLSAKRSWNPDTQHRLEAVAEEALLVLSQPNRSSEPGEGRRIRVVATVTGSDVELEFVSASTDAPEPRGADRPSQGARGGHARRGDRARRVAEAALNVRG